MKKEIQELEAIAKQLAPSAPLRANWNKEVQAYADDFLDQIEILNAYDTVEDTGAVLPLQEQGRSMEEILPNLKQVVDRAGINPASGGHLGYVPGGGLFPSALGDYLAAITNRYAGLFYASPGAVKISNDVLRWLCQLADYPASALGTLTSGGSIANLVAITTARDSMEIKGPLIEKSVIYMSEQAHYCILKALKVAGLLDVKVRNIPLDDALRMRTDLLKDQLEEDRRQGLHPFMIIGSAGTTNTGAIDPLDDLADLAEEYATWFHVDGAYGAPFLLVEEVREKFKGIERSDSLVIDPHKGLFIPYGLGAVLVKDTEALYRSQFYTAGYLQDAFHEEVELSPASLSPELSRHFRALRLWLPLQLFGIAPFRAALQEKLLLCQYFYHEAQKLGLELGPYPELSVTIFRYVPPTADANAFNQGLIESIVQDGRIFLSSTTIDGVFWIRLAVLNFRTHLREVDLCLELIAKYLADSGTNVAPTQNTER